ncbi:uncharacterized protein LOC106140508 [Amyelois transitella]|uniref:uncharacterized protein LOC106140508 n=1 Tax=Amyelois transitella TaxID=680683 RepID=UPI00298F967A|nr:uncharacterized protein LOC106140508 [Amyelois transitella]
MELIILQIHTSVSLPVNVSLPTRFTTLKLKEELAAKYGRLLKSLISINEKRLETMYKLHRLHDLPLSALRSKPEVYAIWRLNLKPDWPEDLLAVETQNDNTESEDLILPIYDDQSNEVTDSTEVIESERKEERKEASSLETWQGTKVFSSEGTDDSDERNLQNDDKEAVKKNLIIVPYVSPLSGSLEIFKASVEVSKDSKDFRRYKYGKNCSRKAKKYCQIACKEAFKKLCGSFQCTSQVKPNYKKQCYYMCLEEFVKDRKNFSC